MFKNCVIIFVIIASFVLAFNCYAEDIPEDVPIFTVHGTVDQVDSVGGILSVLVDGSEMVFSVPEDLKIRRGVDKIGLDDLDSNDGITVEYYRTRDGELKATSITDTNLGNEW